MENCYRCNNLAEMSCARCGQQICQNHAAYYDGNIVCTYCKTLVKIGWKCCWTFPFLIFFMLLLMFL